MRQVLAGVPAAPILVYALLLVLLDHCNGLLVSPFPFSPPGQEIRERTRPTNHTFSLEFIRLPLLGFDTSALLSSPFAHG